MKTVLIHAREAGVASMMATLIQPLVQQGYRLIYDVADHAVGILNEDGQASIEEADLVICGYDLPELDRTGGLLESVSGRVPSLGLLDTWKGVDRFWFSDGTLRQLTDHLIVPDESIRNYLISHGVPHEWPIVGGHPGLEFFGNRSVEERNNLRQQARYMFALDENEQVILLLSEPLRLPNGKRRSLLETNVRDGRKIQQWLADRYDKKFKLAVRLHSIEEQNIPEAWLNMGNCDFDLALASADLIVGLGSTALAYAVAYGKDVHCLDEEVIDWTPEYSEIPTVLWDNLITSGIFQNDPERLSIVHSVKTPGFHNSTEQILNVIKNLI